jgi:large subunit ribosomal protein L21
MYAIVSIAGQQFKVEKNKKIFVHRLPGEAGSMSEFDKVLLIDNEGSVSIGNPYIDDAMVTAKIVSHLKGDKVLVFKKKKRKGYRKLNGHRQYLTEIIIEDILASGAAKRKSATKKEIQEKDEKPQAVAEKTAKAEKDAVKAGPKKAEKPPVETAEKAETKKAGSQAEEKKIKPEAGTEKNAAGKSGSKAGAKKSESKKAEKPAVKTAKKTESKKADKPAVETAKKSGIKKAEPKAAKTVMKTTKTAVKAKSGAGKTKKTETKAKTGKK